MCEIDTLKERDIGFNHDTDNLQYSLSFESPVTPGVYYPSHRTPKGSRQKFSRRKTERAVFKNGEFNIEQPTPKRTSHISNWFNTMIDTKWRWTFLNFFLAHTADWLFFGFIYWIIALNHHDLIDEHLPPNQNSSNWIPCVKNIYGFTSTFLFSIEVHTTVAYGARSITLECPQAITTMCIQCVLSSIFQAIMVGILIAKLTRLKAKTQTLQFSKHAVVSLREDTFCLVFRVGNVSKSRLLNIKASVFLIRKLNFNEVQDHQIELKTELDGCDSTFYLWPVSVIHVINKKSPLYNISAADLLCGDLEMLAVFEGTIETAGKPVQARSSYTGHDILWGHRFVPTIDNIFNVNISKLNVTEHIDTPLCSAFEYETVISDIETMFPNTNNDNGLMH